ncbi:hypothetical protein OHS18_13205 [Amycolatopsis sp. NBC_00355]|uniref:hypothetical protein n=1 Tax=Amycolatopsis sp. NBC_00355 TaxID=2975957 RepID=UPI002E269923
MSPLPYPLVPEPRRRCRTAAAPLPLVIAVLAFAAFLIDHGSTPAAAVALATAALGGIVRILRATGRPA